jgi:AraC family ethanolamine operon transcriptional activator
MSATHPPEADPRTCVPLTAGSVAFCAYTDVDAQARAFTDWHLDYTQISRGAFHGSSSVVSLGGVRVLVERLDKSILQRGAVPAGKIAVAVPLELEGLARMCGEESARDSLHVFSSGPEFEFFSPDQHLLANLEIDVDMLSTQSLRNFAGMLHEAGMTPVVPMNAATAMRFRQTLRDALALSTDAISLPQIEQFQGVLLSLMAEVVEGRSGASERSLTTRSTHHALVMAIQRELETPETCPLSIAEVCGKLGVSRRTVQYAFQHALNLNPVTYLRAVRLNHVRRDLRRGESVTGAATRWGFLHLGSFAHDYRTMFNELPSVTAKKYSRVDRDLRAAAGS